LPGLREKGQKIQQMLEGWQISTLINERFAHPVALLKCDWWEECRMSREDGFLKTKVNTEGRNLHFLDASIHVSHKDDLVAIQSPGGDIGAKVAEECGPGWAGVILTE